MNKMNQNKNNFFSRLSIRICPMLLGAFICFTVLYALYRPMALVCTIIYFVAQYLIFAFFDKIKTRKTIGGLIYIALLVIATAVAIMLIFSGAQSTDISPITWFYGEQGSYFSAPAYLAALLVWGGFFLISILYYFTQVRYRSLGVMLCTLFPFVIYAKRAEEVPEILVTLIITLFLAVMVHNRRMDPALPAQRRGKLSLNISYILSMALFVSVTGAITMLIEKPEYQSELERNSNYFDAVQTNATGSGGNYESVTTSSSQRYGGDSGTGTILFYFETDGDLDEYFLRRQAYDYFDGDVWQVDTDSAYDAASLGSDKYITIDVLDDMQKLSDVYYFDATPSAELSILKSGRAYDEDFASAYLPAPLSTVIPDESSTSYFQFAHGEIYRSNGDEKALNDSYTFYEQSSELYEYAYELGLSIDDYFLLLDDALDNSDEYEELANDFYEAYDSYTSTDGVSDEVTELAEEITADCYSAMEKALALESYFEDNGYNYDLDYQPEDESIEYFLFEGKTGVCSSYATAMTLMARAVGLPSRYVEGFAAFEKDDDGSFVIRDSYAHAFVEVYIPGAGWLTFDPTVSDYMNIDIDDSSFDVATFVQVFSRLLVVIVVLFVVVFIIFLDRIIELIFRLGLHFKTPYEATLALYTNVIKLVNLSTKDDYSSYTVKMLREYLQSTRGIAPEKLFELFEKTCFGGYNPSKEEFIEAYNEYKRCYKYLRRIPKPSKKSTATV